MTKTFQDDSDATDSDQNYAHSMVSRMTGGTVRPGPGYNTGTLKSTLSGFTAGSLQDTDEANILSDASTSQNSDDLPLPEPKKLTPQKLTPKPLSPTPAQNSPFVNIKKPPALPAKAPVSQPPVKVEPPKQPEQPAKKSPKPIKTDNETDADCLSDASNSDLSLSELGDTTEQESDWPEMNQKVTSIKPRAVTPQTPVAVKPPSPALSKASSRAPSKITSRAPSVASSRPSKAPSVKQSDAEIITDYDDLRKVSILLFYCRSEICY